MIRLSRQLRPVKEKGRIEGREEGEMRKLIQQVCRKLAKGKTTSEIAVDLEEETEIIEKICRAVQQCGPEADAEQIYVAWQELE